MDKKIGIYAGSFDPFTNGHMAIVDEALKVFDIVEIAVGINPRKQRYFDVNTAAQMIEEATRDNPNIVVGTFEGTLIRYAEKRNATAIVRGLRQIGDFNDEFTLHGNNRMISDIPITYFISPVRYLHVSSSAVRELASYGEDFSSMVPPNIYRMMTDGL